MLVPVFNFRYQHLSFINKKKSSPTSVTNIADMDFQKSQKFEKQVSYIGNDAFNEIHFIYSIQRLPAFYVLNMIVPIFLMFFLSIFVFYLPTGLCSSTVIYYRNLLRFAHYEPSVLCWSWNRGIWKDDFVNFDFDFSNSLFITFGETYPRNVARYSFAWGLSTFYNVHGIG